MSIFIPAFLGIVVKKNDRTRPFVLREAEFLKKRVIDKNIQFNEDEFLIGFSVAMDGNDLKNSIEDLQRDGAVEGVDFVATSSFEGVIGSLPIWLCAGEVIENGLVCKVLNYIDS